MTKERLEEIRRLLETCPTNHEELSQELVTALEAALAENYLLYEELAYLKELITGLMKMATRNCTAE